MIHEIGEIRVYKGVEASGKLLNSVCCLMDWGRKPAEDGVLCRNPVVVIKITENCIIGV